MDTKLKLTLKKQLENQTMPENKIIETTQL